MWRVSRSSPLLVCSSTARARRCFSRASSRATAARAVSRASTTPLESGPRPPPTPAAPTVNSEPPPRTAARLALTTDGWHVSWRTRVRSPLS
eukprot:4836019-Prymnesium_polylepis.1